MYLLGAYYQIARICYDRHHSTNQMGLGLIGSEPGPSRRGLRYESAFLGNAKKGGPRKSLGGPSCMLDTYFSLRRDSEGLQSTHQAAVEEQKQFWAYQFRNAGWQTDRFIDGMRDTQRKERVATSRLSQASIKWCRRWMFSTHGAKSIVLLFTREPLLTYILRTISIHLNQMPCELTTITASTPPECKPTTNCQPWLLPPRGSDVDPIETGAASLEAGDIEIVSGKPLTSGSYRLRRSNWASIAEGRHGSGSVGNVSIWLSNCR
jgi:hypothetical protein